MSIVGEEMNLEIDSDISLFETQESKDADSAMSNVLALEKVRKCLQDAKEPIVVQEARILNNMLIRMNQPAVISEESFHGRQNRIASIKLAVEDIGERVRTIAKTLLRWLKRITEVVFDHIEGILRGANALTAEAGAIQSKANTIKAVRGSGGLPGVTIGSNKLASFFTSNGRSLDSKSIANAFERMSDSFNDGLSKKLATQGSQYVATQITKIIVKKKTGNFDEEQALQISNAAIDYMLENNFTEFVEKSKDTRVMELPFGGVRFVLSVNQQDGLFSSIGVAKQVAKIGNVDKHLPVLSPDEIINLGKTVESSMHRGMYRDYKEIKSAAYSLKVDIEKLADSVSKEQRETFQGTIPSLHFLKTITETMLKIINMAYSYSGVSARYILEYCRLSIAQYPTE